MRTRIGGVPKMSGAKPTPSGVTRSIVSQVGRKEGRKEGRRGPTLAIKRAALNVKRPRSASRSELDKSGEKRMCCSSVALSVGSFPEHTYFRECKLSPTRIRFSRTYLQTLTSLSTILDSIVGNLFSSFNITGELLSRPEGPRDKKRSIEKITAHSRSPI